MLRYVSPRRQAEVRRELQRARLGRAIAERMRHESVEKQRESARAARAAGLPAAEIASAAGISVPRVYQLLSGAPYEVTRLGSPWQAAASTDPERAGIA